MANSIAFIDKRVAIYLNIAGSFNGNAGVVLFEPSVDSVAQIPDYLAGRSAV